MDKKPPNQKEPETVVSYDEMPYISSAFPEIHPNRLAFIATLFGMPPTPITNCRLLELGCGSASNLIATACGLPDSQFVGVDLSLNEVNIANERIKAIGLKNIEVKHANIMEMDKNFGSFDYILAPGVYSWVPPDVREKVLIICSELLTQHGVAYVNYNTYPGWNFYKSLRDMLLYRTNGINNPRDMVKEARSFAHLLTETIPPENDPLGLFLKNTVAQMDTWDDGHLRHDLLGDINQPFYFHEFITAANKHRLQYLGEAPIHTMMTAFLPERFQRILKTAEGDPVKIEQYMDFVRNRQFRETLLCHADVSLNRKLSPETLRSFYFTTQITPVSAVPNLLSNKEEQFISSDNITVSSDHPIVKAMLTYLSIESPKPSSFKDIIDNVKDALGQGNFVMQEFEEKADGQTVLLANLLKGISMGYIQAIVHPLPITLQVSDHPQTTPVIRYEAKHQLIVTNQLHQMVTIDNFTHHILPLLDGKNSQDDILTTLIGLAKSGVIHLQLHGKPLTDENEIRKILKDQLLNILKRAAKSGLLIG